MILPITRTSGNVVRVGLKLCRRKRGSLEPTSFFKLAIHIYLKDPKFSFSLSLSRLNNELAL